MLSADTRGGICSLVARPGLMSNLAAAASSAGAASAANLWAHGHNAVMTGVTGPVVVACRMIELSYSCHERLGRCELGGLYENTFVELPL